jgi:hypothetical protein
LQQERKNKMLFAEQIFAGERVIDFQDLLALPVARHVNERRLRGFDWKKKRRRF